MHHEHSRSNRLDGLFKKREGLATVISVDPLTPPPTVLLSTPEIVLSFLLVRLDCQAGRTL